MLNAIDEPQVQRLEVDSKYLFHTNETNPNIFTHVVLKSYMDITTILLMRIARMP